MLPDFLSLAKHIRSIYKLRLLCEHASFDYRHYFKFVYILEWNANLTTGSKLLLNRPWFSRFRFCGPEVLFVNIIAIVTLSNYPAHTSRPTSPISNQSSLQITLNFHCNSDHLTFPTTMKPRSRIVTWLQSGRRSMRQNKSLLYERWSWNFWVRACARVCKLLSVTKPIFTDGLVYRLVTN